jgi:hypothetical protein
VQTETAVVDWLMEGDPSIRWQVMRDLLDEPAAAFEAERAQVAKAGWGAALLERQEPKGTWAGGLYNPKWTSTFYTLLLLRDLGLPGDNEGARRAAEILLDRGKRNDGGLDYSTDGRHSETCVTGMGLSMLARFGVAPGRLEPIVEHLLRQQMDDGGWNCQSYSGDTHASFHTTISALEGLREWAAVTAASPGVLAARERGHHFLLAHRLFRSHRTGAVAKPEFTRFSFPPRWHYDVLRSLDYFQSVRAPREAGFEDAIALVEKRRQADGRWLLQNVHRGAVFFELEAGASQPSRWNTLRALRVLRWWNSSA